MNTPSKLTKPVYPFNEQDAQRAWEEWGANCGPTALAAMLNLHINEVRQHIPKFEERHYTNPSMMKAALANLRVPWLELKFDPMGGKLENWKHTLTRYGLVRIQWEGPWTQPGANPRWAYRQTHWIGAAVWRFYSDEPITWVFDCNSGWTTQQDWEHIHVPRILKSCVPRATGGWFATDRWELFASPR